MAGAVYKAWEEDEYIGSLVSQGSKCRQVLRRSQSACMLWTSKLCVDGIKEVYIKEVSMQISEFPSISMEGKWCTPKKGGMTGVKVILSIQKKGEVKMRMLRFQVYPSTLSGCPQQKLET